MGKKELSPEILEEKLNFGNWKVKRIKEYQINRLPNFIEPIKAELILKLLVEMPTSEAMNLMLPKKNGIEKITLEVTEDELWLMRMALKGHTVRLDKEIREQIIHEMEAECKEEQERAQRLKKSFEGEKELAQNLLERLKNREA